MPGRMHTFSIWKCKCSKNCFVHSSNIVVGFGQWVDVKHADFLDVKAIFLSNGIVVNPSYKTVEVNNWDLCSGAAKEDVVTLQDNT